MEKWEYHIGYKWQVRKYMPTEPIGRTQVAYYAIKSTSIWPSEIVHGPAGLKLPEKDHVRLSLEVQDPHTLFWRQTSTVFFGETWRISQRTPGLAIKGETAQSLRAEMETWQNVLGQEPKKDPTEVILKIFRIGIIAILSLNVLFCLFILLIRGINR